MKYRVIVDSDHAENEPTKRIRATPQQFPRMELAQQYAATCAESHNPQVVPAGSEYEETAADMLKRVLALTFARSWSAMIVRRSVRMRPRIRTWI